MTSVSLSSVISISDPRFLGDNIEVSRQSQSIANQGFKTVHSHISPCSLNWDTRLLESCSAPFLPNLTRSLSVIGGKRALLCRTLPLMVVRSSMQPPSAPLPSLLDSVKNLL